MLVEESGVDLLGALVATLEKCPCLRERSSRQLFLDLAAAQLGESLGVENHENAHYFHVELAMVCQRGTGTMAAVLGALDRLDKDAALAVRRAGAELLAAPVLSAEALEELRPLLKGLSTPRLARICRDAAGPLHDLPPYPDAWSAFEALSGLNAREDMLPPALALVEYLAAEASAPDSFEHGFALRGWNDTQAATLGLVSALGALRQRVNYPAPTSEYDAHLIVRLLPREEPGRYQLTSWRHFGTEDAEDWQPRQGPTAVVDLAQAERTVQDLLYEAEAYWASDAGSIHVEFALMSEQLDLPVHLWRTELDSAQPARLCDQYTVVVRSLLRSRTPRWHRLWKQRWQLLLDSPGQWRSFVVGGPAPHHPPARQPAVLERRLRAEQSVGCVVLSEPAGQRVAELEVALRTGVPVMMWLGPDHTGAEGGQDPRAAAEESPGAVSENAAGTPADRNPYHPLPVDSTEEPLGVLLRDPFRLREAVKQLRLEALSDSSGHPRHRVGRQVVLLWDDPTRPVEGHGPLAGPHRGRRADAAPGWRGVDGR